MEPTTQLEPKLNIFALSNQTTIIFGLIVTIVLGTVFAGSFGLAPFPVWPLALGLLLLSLRAFLARPERDFARKKLIPAGNDLAVLQQAITDNAEAMGLHKTPRLMVSPEAIPLYTFGTFRRWFIAMSHSRALELQQELDKPDLAAVIEAKLIHELYHFKTGDYWQMGYAGELLRLTFVFMLWLVVFLLGYGLLLVIAGPAIVQSDPMAWVDQVEGLTPEMRQVFRQIMPSSDEMEEARKKAENLNLGVVLNFAISAMLPFILTGATLWFFYRPKLWRTREFYADAGVVHTQKEIAPFLAGYTNVPLILLRKYKPSISLISSSHKKGLQNTIRTTWQSIRGLTAKHPQPVKRIASVMDPPQVFDSWLGTAIVLGVFTLLLDFILNSSFTLFYIGQWPMHLSILVLLIVVSLSLIPPLILEQTCWSNMFKIVLVVATLRLALVLIIIGILVIYLFADPAGLATMLTVGAATISGFSRYMTTDEVEALAFKTDELPAFVLEASIFNLAQVFIIFFILTVALTVIIFLLRRLLTWYALPRAEQRLMRASYLVIGVATLFVGLTVLPFLTTLLLRPTELFNLLGILVGALGVGVTILGLGLFLYADRRYAQRCPNCEERVCGSYQLGKRCTFCNELLHSWLIADYKS